MDLYTKLKIWKLRITKFLCTISGIKRKRNAKARFWEVTNSELHNNYPWYGDLYLKDINVKFKGNEIQYEITIFSPGIFIGKAGQTINNIKRNLEAWYPGDTVNIKIIEWKNPWDWSNVKFVE